VARSKKPQSSGQPRPTGRVGKKPESNAAETVTLKIPRPLFERLTTLIDGTGFRSVTEFAVHVLRDVASGGKLEERQPGLSPRELELVRNRLRALGYIE
jgi:hypothetical protein